MITDEALAQAIDRIARTPDGELLYLYLQKTMMGVVGEYAPRGSALRTHHGERSFAARLMGLMAKGIDERGGRKDPSGTGEQRPSERPVVFAPRKPASTGRHESFRDYASRSDPELRPLVAEPGPGDD